MSRAIRLSAGGAGEGFADDLIARAAGIGDGEVAAARTGSAQWMGSRTSFGVRPVRAGTAGIRTGACFENYMDGWRVGRDDLVAKLTGKQSPSGLLVPRGDRSPAALDTANNRRQRRQSSTWHSARSSCLTTLPSPARPGFAAGRLPGAISTAGSPGADNPPLACAQLAAGGGDVVAALGAHAVAHAARAQRLAEGADRLARRRPIRG